MDQSYTWWVSDPGERLAIRMDVHEEGQPDFHATLVGAPPPAHRGLAPRGARPLPADARVRRRADPLQALRLWLKRTPFHRKPPFVPGQGSVRS